MNIVIIVKIYIIILKVAAFIYFERKVGTFIDCLGLCKMSKCDN